MRTLCGFRAGVGSCCSIVLGSGVLGVVVI